jgi:hypothetical protein
MTEVFMMSDRQNKLQERLTITFIISAYRQRSEGVNVVPYLIASRKSRRLLAWQKGVSIASEISFAQWPKA